MLFRSSIVRSSVVPSSVVRSTVGLRIKPVKYFTENITGLEVFIVVNVQTDDQTHNVQTDDAI